MEHNSTCYFHPKQQQLIGVCHFCLNERLLLLLATNQGKRFSSSSTGGGHGIIHAFPLNKLPKIFALGSLLNLLEFKHSKSENSDDVGVSSSTSSTSQEDSFISIKFEENGVASWENGEVNSKVSIEHCSKPWNPTLTKELTNEPKVANKIVIEHAQPRASLRWRKRIGHLFQLIKGKRSNKSMCGTWEAR